jgi:prepilin peptidase CpaA
MISFEWRAGVVLAIALIAVAFDLRTRRIPNWLTFGAAAAALAAGWMDTGAPGLGRSALAWFVGALIFFPLFALRGMGAGDVKLVAALSAWLGPIEAVYLAIFASLAGGVVAIVVSVSQGYLRTALSNVWLMLTHWRVAGPRPVPGFTLQDTRAPRLAFAIPITIGLVCTLWRL